MSFNEIAKKIQESAGISPDSLPVLESRLKEISTQRKIIHREIFSDWSRIVHDFNPIHYDEEKAKSLGFLTTPCYGSLLASHSEQYALKFLKILNTYSQKPLKYSAHSLQFKEPVYPNDSLSWQIEDVSSTNNSLELKIIGKAGEKSAVLSGIKFSDSLELPSQEEETFFSSTNSVDPHNINQYYKCLQDSNCSIPIMYPASFIPSTLLELLSEKTGKQEGVYLSLNLKFHSPPKFGKIKTVLFKPKTRKIQDSYFYSFKTRSLQDSPILSGEIKCVSKYNLIC